MTASCGAHPTKTARSLGARTLWPWALLGVAATLACGSGSDVTGPSSEPAGIVDAELVGTWLGDITGGNGVRTESGEMTLTLGGDGSLTVQVTNPAYHPINRGEWSVIGDQFTGLGIDSTGGSVDFGAPRSTTRLDGTWRSAGGAGTFSVTRQ